MKKKLAALLVGAMLTFATSAMADVLYVGSNFTGSGNPAILGTWDGSAVQWGGGSMDVSTLTSSLGTRTLPYLYCVDVFNDVPVGNYYSQTSVNYSGQIHGSTLNNADKVAFLVQNYGANSGQTDQARALQAAIWTEIYSTGQSHTYTLNSDAYGSNSNIVGLYNTYIDAAKNVSTTGYASHVTWINPDNGSGTVYQGLVTSGPVPEPSTIVLLVTGMLGMAVFGKRRMIKTAQ